MKTINGRKLAEPNQRVFSYCCRNLSQLHTIKENQCHTQTSSFIRQHDLQPIETVTTKHVIFYEDVQLIKLSCGAINCSDNVVQYYIS